MVVAGRQGAGKGTQCVRLSRHYVVPHISTGDMLRSAVKEGTELGQRADSIMKAGGLVPDDVMIGIVDERLRGADARTRGYLLDGFPRTVAQAEAMEKITVDNALDLAIDLDVPREMVLQRLSARRLCRDCGTNYTSTGYERRPWLCDVCGGDIIHREDDTEEAINRRLDDYESQTRPLIDFYESRGLLVTVSGVGTPDQVLVRLISAIESRRRGPNAGLVVGGG
jgi:adenylate kinase